MNLDGWFTLAALADEAGVDLWHYRHERRPFAAGRARVPRTVRPRRGPVAAPADHADRQRGLVRLLERAALVWRDDRYRALAGTLRRSSR